ncbi:DUF2149 domain-containing protein [Baekduia sp.]|jgi:hypothetical protein|uniref:DUF2149 domain-containing protein n=1 Tax=Baekduia sp. TaxID=2600305 RepID=UPI002E073209|nr:DUF2149 domain-containing protein [Baekduia sp.]
MNRATLGRHGRIADDSGDPLDGLVNLFDLGLVLAVAFLVAGFGLSVNKTTGKIEPRTSTTPATTTTTVPQQQPGLTTSGRGNAIGTLYRLADGRLVVVEPGGKVKPVSP